LKIVELGWGIFGLENPMVENVLAAVVVGSSLIIVMNPLSRDVIDPPRK
jgi:hypothetical protein